MVGRALGGGVDGGRPESPLPVVERPELDGGVAGSGGRLVLADVGPGGTEHLRPRLGQEPEGDLVAHRP